MIRPAMRSMKSGAMALHVRKTDLMASPPGMPFTNNTEEDWDRTFAANATRRAVSPAQRSCQGGDLGVGSDGAPERFRDRRLSAHIVITNLPHKEFWGGNGCDLSFFAEAALILT